MKNLLYKEFALSIPKGFIFFALFGMLLLIPSWLYPLAMMYVLFIAVPNLFSLAKANKDIEYSLCLPIKKNEVVKARICAVGVLQIAMVLSAIPFAAINILVYKGGNHFSEPNVAFFGLTFMMYGIFNLIFFPMFYKTGYKLAWPSVIGILAALIFSALAEVLNIAIPSSGDYLGSVNHMSTQIPVLLLGILLFLLLTMLAYQISAKRFGKVDF